MVGLGGECGRLPVLAHGAEEVDLGFRPELLHRSVHSVGVGWLAIAAVVLRRHTRCSCAMQDRLAEVALLVHGRALGYQICNHSNVTAHCRQMEGCVSEHVS